MQSMTATLHSGFGCRKSVASESWCCVFSNKVMEDLSHVCPSWDYIWSREITQCNVTRLKCSNLIKVKWLEGSPQWLPHGFTFPNSNQRLVWSWDSITHMHSLAVEYMYFFHSLTRHDTDIAPKKNDFDLCLSLIVCLMQSEEVPLIWYPGERWRPFYLKILLNLICIKNNQHQQVQVVKKISHDLKNTVSISKIPFQFKFIHYKIYISGRFSCLRTFLFKHQKIGCLQERDDTSKWSSVIDFQCCTAIYKINTSKWKDSPFLLSSSEKIPFLVSSLHTST